jgi:lipopolysaccharide/colanic/teichoic acid biosynthesis glycosyltransferase
LRKYEAGEMVHLMYYEPEDKYFIADDNEYYKKMFDTARNSIIFTLIIPITMMIAVLLLITIR